MSISTGFTFHSVKWPAAEIPVLIAFDLYSERLMRCTHSFHQIRSHRRSCFPYQKTDFPSVLSRALKQLDQG
jgi:hypothetical protein